MFQGHSVMVGGLLAMCEVTLSRDRNHIGGWYNLECGYAFSLWAKHPRRLRILPGA